MSKEPTSKKKRCVTAGYASDTKDAIEEIYPRLTDSNLLTGEDARVKQVVIISVNLSRFLGLKLSTFLKKLSRFLGGCHCL